MDDRSSYIQSESPLKNILLRWFSKYDKLVIFDIGACEGEESIRYSKIFPKSTIFSFEPLNSNISIIRSNLTRYLIDNVKIFELALSNEKGVLDFHVSNGKPQNIPEGLNWDFGNKSSSLLLPYKHTEITPWLRFEKIIKVHVDTLKNIMNYNGIKGIDFIHLDVQGAELNVLSGAESYLKNIKLVWMEVSDIQLYKNQPLKNDVENFMKKNNFKLLKSEFSNHIGDQLYINKKYVLFLLIKKMLNNIYRCFSLIK